MSLSRTPHATRIKCDCEAEPCDAEDFVSYSLYGMAVKQAKDHGWRRKRRGDVYWFAPGHRGHWEKA